MEDIDPTAGTNYKSYQKVYRYKTEGVLIPHDSLDIDTMVTKTSRREDIRPGRNAYVDVATGKFNTDPYDDAVSVWRTSNSNQKIEIMISHFDTTGFFNTTTAITLDAGEDIKQSEEIYVRTGNFDSDSTDEFIVAFRDLSDSVIFYLYDVDSTLQATTINRFSYTKVNNSSLAYFVKYFIEVADLNADGIDELITFTWETGVTSTYVPVMIRVYAFESGSVVPKGTTLIEVPRIETTALQGFVMAAAKGQFDSDEYDEFVFSSVVKANNIHRSQHYIVNVSQNLSSISVGQRQQFTLTSHNPNSITEFCVAAGDLNDTYNKRDEVIFVAGTQVRVCSVRDDYTLQPLAQVPVANGGGSDYIQSNNFLKVSDLNMDRRKDILVVKNVVAVTPLAGKGFLTYAITFEDSTLVTGTHKTFARLFEDENQNDTYHQYAIAVGNFDGFDFRIGQPTVTRVFGTVEPIVILNAPPIHFDKFGNNIFDLNTCFPDPVNNCDFYTKYWTYNQTSTEVTIESLKDWQVSAGVRLAGEYSIAPMGVGITQNYEIWATYKHGRHFSNSTTTGTSQTISVTIQAKDDDRIYAIVEDCDIWEYPVFHGNETISRRSYFAFVPQNPQGKWFGSKDPEAFNYFPKHQIGNILSYDDSLSNNNNISKLLESRGNDGFVVGASSSYNKHWLFERFRNVQADTSRENSFDAGAKFIIEATYAFSKKEVSTSKTTVKSGFDLEVNMGPLNPSYSNAQYSITPYAYWSNDDAIVLDYTVNPSLGGGNPTWWQVMYGDNPDPTFVLPWRLDIEKGYGTPANQLLYSKSISFSNNKPDPGDTITITAQVRNFSLIPTQTPVVVSFYLGDPDSGGTPIIGVHGTNNINTNSTVSARGRSDVEFKWVVPNGLPSYPRVYAVLDQENSITEIHEDNNKGYNILGIYSVTGVEDENNIVPEEYTLYQSYPNPFNPSTTIKYSLPASDMVSLKVFDILGREVAVLVNEYKTSGTYSIEFNANRFASGVYFYQLKSGNFLETKKMTLLK
jgi:hypothetical protein